jgi:hypothetical protein
MIDRVNFLESVQGIQYPEMLVQFFDQLILLKQLVEDQGSISVMESGANSISFSVNFKNKDCRDMALNAINGLGGRMIIYQKPISVACKPLTDSELIIYLS